MRQAPSVIVSASLVAACLGAGAGYAYSQFVLDGGGTGQCSFPESRTGNMTVLPKTRGETSAEDPSLSDYSWRRWPSLVDF